VGAPKTSPLTFPEADFPALYLAADHASRSTQRRYALLTGVILGGLVAGAGLSALSRIFPDYARAIAFATAGLTSMSFMLTTIRWALKPEKQWYAGRAVAEAVRSQTWLFVTDAGRYPATLTADEASATFLEDLRTIIQDEGQSALGFGSEFIEHPQITARMRALRAASLDVRRDLYLTARLQDQRKWYGARARKNQAAGTRSYILIQFSQAGALASSVLLVSPYMSAWDFGGLFSAVASALIGWMHLRQYQELAHAYAVAALDLGLIEERAGMVRTEPEFVAFVTDAEAAIGRERTVWTARRQ
jgi:hypothetical protein